MSKTQLQHFTESQHKIFDGNRAFLEMVNHPTNPMTREDLEALLRRRPAVYGRFAGYLDMLPQRAANP